MLQAFAVASIEHGDHRGEDKQGRAVMQLAVQSWTFEALCLLRMASEDMPHECTC